MVWQIAFLIIGSNPVRFRPMMVAAILEKLGYVATLGVMYLRGRISAIDTQPLLPDLLLGILFVIAFAKTANSGRASDPTHQYQQ
jgi:hypothetical protein